MITRQKQYAQPYFNTKELARSPQISAILIYCVSKISGIEIDEDTSFEALEKPFYKFFNNLEGDSFFIYHNAVKRLEFEKSDPSNLSDLLRALNIEIDDYLHILGRFIINTAHSDLFKDENANPLSNMARIITRTGVLRTFIRPFILRMIRKNFILKFDVRETMIISEPRLQELISAYDQADSQVYPGIPEERTEYRDLVSKRYGYRVPKSNSENVKESRIQKHGNDIVRWLDKVKEG